MDPSRSESDQVSVHRLAPMAGRGEDLGIQDHWKMKITEWQAHYTYPNPERFGGSTGMVMGGFLSKEDAEAFVADDKTDSAIHCRLGWFAFDRIEAKTYDVDYEEFLDEVKSKISKVGTHKVILFGWSMNKMYEQAAADVPCRLEYCEDHFDSFAVFKPGAFEVVHKGRV